MSTFPRRLFFLMVSIYSYSAFAANPKPGTECAASLGGSLAEWSRQLKVRPEFVQFAERHPELAPNVMILRKVFAGLDSDMIRDLSLASREDMDAPSLADRIESSRGWGLPEAELIKRLWQGVSHSPDFLDLLPMSDPGKGAVDSARRARLKLVLKDEAYRPGLQMAFITPFLNLLPTTAEGKLRQILHGGPSNREKLDRYYQLLHLDNNLPVGAILSHKDAVEFYEELLVGYFDLFLHGYLTEKKISAIRLLNTYQINRRDFLGYVHPRLRGFPRLTAILDFLFFATPAPPSHKQLLALMIQNSREMLVTAKNNFATMQRDLLVKAQREKPPPVRVQSALPYVSDPKDFFAPRTGLRPPRVKPDSRWSAKKATGENLEAAETSRASESPRADKQPEVRSLDEFLRAKDPRPISELEADRVYTLTFKHSAHRGRRQARFSAKVIKQMRLDPEFARTLVRNLALGQFVRGIGIRKLSGIAVAEGGHLMEVKFRDTTRAILVYHRGLYDVVEIKSKDEVERKRSYRRSL